MRLQRIKMILEDQKKEKKENKVVDLLQNYRKAFMEPDLENVVSLRLGEIDALHQIIHAAVENCERDEAFYRESVNKIMYLLKERFEELVILVDALSDEKTEAKRKTLKVVA